MKGCTYSIVRSHRGQDGVWEKVEQTGLDWDTAVAERDKAQAAEDKAHPERTSWTKDLFQIQLETVLTYSVIRASDNKFVMRGLERKAASAALAKFSKRGVHWLQLEAP